MNDSDYLFLTFGYSLSIWGTYKARFIRTELSPDDFMILIESTPNSPLTLYTPKGDLLIQ
jgi:hypothetical protein